jgi:hypothetical protein
MTRKLGWLLLTVAFAVPAPASGKPGSISGFVRNANGTPQMGAMVEVFTSASQALTVFSDAQGHYSAALSPGTYQIKVSAPSYLPSLRENISLKAGASMVVNLTLNTIFEAIQLAPPRQRAAQDEDDWKWTLRSMANRPILRVHDDGPMVVVSQQEKSGDARALKARVAFIAGSDAEGFGGAADMTTAFKIEHSLFSAGTLSFDGNVGYSSGTPATIVRTAYSHRMPDGSRPELALTVRRFATPDMVLRNAALQALALSVNNTATLGNLLEFNYGGELESIQFMGRVTAFRPFGSVDLHLSPNTVVEYRYATSEPNMRHAKGFDSAPADLSESGPRVSQTNSVPQLERARHQEVSVSRRVGKSSFQVAVYSDHISNAALTGAGEVSGGEGEFLPDVYSGTFNYNGGDLDTNGLRLVAQRKLSDNLTATLDYAFGGVLALDQVTTEWPVRGSLHTHRQHSLAAKLAGEAPRSHTRFLASYRWINNGQALTPVDLFNASAGQTDPYLNVFIRQPIPGTRFFPGRMEALVDLRNLLAQGYVPVVTQDGSTIYLVQSARAVRGGLAFIF